MTSHTKLRSGTLARTVSTASALVLLPLTAAAGEATNDMSERIYVWGIRPPAIGQTKTASEGMVLFPTFQDRPIQRPGQIAEFIPGLAVTQHSGSGKANQFFLRGFNLDHGTDFSVSLDGVPLNLRSHAHGQGYLDLNVITPELLQRIEYRKGPYFADAGDFSTAGTAALETFASAPVSFIEGWGGSHGYVRAVGVQSTGTSSYLAADFTANNGPWTSPEKLRKGNVMGRFQVVNWAVTAIGYYSEWKATDQIPLRAVEAGTLSRFGNIDPSDGGRTSRFIVSARNTSASGWNTVLYAQKYDLKLWSNFTYFLDNPTSGDQFEQADDRWVLGGSTRKTWLNAIGGWDVTAGAEARDDIVGNVGLYRTLNRSRTGMVRADKVHEYSAGFWLEGAKTLGALRATLGGRVDAIGANVTSNNTLNSGFAADALFSPKATLAYRATQSLEFYASAGRGFHSNDARGATAVVSPISGFPADRVNLIAPTTGGEAGMRWETQSFTASMVAFWTQLDSELVYVGDAGETEPTSGSRRYGGEFLVNWRPFERTEFDFSAAATNARYRGFQPFGNRIPNAIEYMFTGGASYLVTDALAATFTVRSLGAAPLIEDNSARSREATISNLLLRYRLGRFTFSAQILNLFDARANDIMYFYGSRLPSEPASGVDGYHIHPAEPRAFRFGLRVDMP